MQTKHIKTTFLVFLLAATVIMAQKPYRVGTTALNFLEYGYGSAGSAMGDAYVSMAEDVSAIYWNPAGLAFMDRSEAQLTMQPWIADINTSFFAAGIFLPGVGTIGVSLISVGYGDMDVTTLDFQEGTGEIFDANDFAISLAFSRQITDWFSFGLAGKYVSSQIWHMEGSALALDLGALVHTGFFSPTGKRDDGLKIGMSISNYGSRIQYAGADATYPVDIYPDDNGNYQYVRTQFKMNEWELPQIFRIGASFSPVVTRAHRLTIAVDALHPNNNAESLNIGAQYTLSVPVFGKFYLRAGYKGLFLEDSQYGFSAGGGLFYNLFGNMGLRINYSYQDLGILGGVNSYGVGVMF